VRREEAERQGHAGDEQRADIHLPVGPGMRLEVIHMAMAVRTQRNGQEVWWRPSGYCDCVHAIL